MKIRIYAVATALCVSPAVLQGQSAPVSQAAAEQSAAEQSAAPVATSLREQLMPSAVTLAVTAPATRENTDAARPLVPPVAAARGAGLPLMIAGGALFVAGLIAGGDGGTVLVIAGAGIGAYGLYLYFQ